MPRIFVSYSRADDGSGLVRAFVDQLADEITRMTGWDERDLFYHDMAVFEGEHWSGALVAALRECDVFLALLSPRYFQSEVCGKEWGLFERRLTQHRERHGGYPRGLVPVIWEALSNRSAIPEVVGRYQWGGPSAGLRQLVLRSGRAKDDLYDQLEQLSRVLVDVAGRRELEAADEDWGDLADAVNVFAGTPPPPAQRIPALASSASSDPDDGSATAPTDGPVADPAPAPATGSAADPAGATVPATPELQLLPRTAELLRFAIGLSGGAEVGAAHVVLAALVRFDRTSLGRDALATGATTALYRAVPAPAEPRIAAALSAFGVDRLPAPQPFADDDRVRSVVDEGRALARRLGVTTVYSHHVVGAALITAPLPGPVLDALGVTADQLRSAFRARVGQRWPGEPAAVWDDLLGPVRELAVADETAELWRWVAAVRWARGPGPVDDTDVVLGALAAARAEPAGGSAEALYRAVPGGDLAHRLVPADDLTRQQRLDAALTAAGAADVDTSVGPSEVGRTPTTSRAAAIATRVSGSPVVGRRHLLAAALTGGPPPTSILDALGVDVQTLRDALTEYLARTWPQEPAAAWDEVLTVEVEYDSRFSPDSVTAGPIEDHLDLSVYVGMLGTLIVRKNTKVPLSIGLFGEWGSGKSYFMQLLSRKIEELAGGAAATPDGPYHAEILQIRFNAWHYTDTNLWASLASEFFVQIARDLGGDETDPVATQRASVEEQLADAQRDRVEAEASGAAAQEKAARLRRDLAQAPAEQDPADGADLLRAAADDPEIRTQLTAVAGQLGLTDDTTRELAQDLDQLRGNLTATRRVLARRSMLLPFAVLVGVTLVLAVALAVVRSWPASTLAAVAGLLTSATVVIGRARRLTDTLRGLVDRAQRVQQRVQENRAQQRATLAAALDEAEAEAARERHRREEAENRIAQLSEELAGLSPERQLSAYLTGRATSPDYRAKLGVVSIVRQDFEELVTRMKRWKDAYQDGVGRKPIDRIVLYIDDLDRCEPDQVVTVLQAVHLLLAMDLFVVVVGVDPRWLLRSLSRRYRRVLGSTATADERDAGFSASTPQNYLEKIFQVPFVLPGMDPVGFTGLLTHLARPDREPDTPIIVPAGPSARPATDATRPAPPARSGSADPARSAGVSGLDAEEGSEVKAVQIAAQPGPTPLDPPERVSGEPTRRPPGTVTPIDDDELALLGTLAPLVRTPRAATRLFNVYGLVRSTRNLTAGGRFLNRPGSPGDYQAVVVLLGVLIATPELLGPLLWGRRAADGTAVHGLCRPSSTASWKAFVATLEPEETDGTWRNGVVDALSPEEVPAWRELRGRLQDVGRHVDLDDIERYREWAPKIARFSFLMSPFTADEPERAVSPRTPSAC